MALTKIEASNIAAGAVASSGFNSVQIFTSGGTWTKPADITKVIVEVQGAGGAGSYSAVNNTIGGGVAGGYVMAVLDVTDITTCTVVVGAGGVGVASGSAGASGGLASFTKLAGTGSFTALSATGGTGNTTGSGQVGVGGSGPVGALIITSANPGIGLDYEWEGGASKFGFGGQAAYTGYDPNPNATGYGSGGGGARSTTAGSGTDGLIIVWEYK